MSARLSSVLIFALLGACGDNHAQAPKPPSVTVAPPLVKTISDWDEYTGRFDAIASVELRARVSGYLQEIKFRDGDLVEKGQVLFIIDPRPYQAALDRAEADLARDESTVERAGTELDRASKLLVARAISQEEFDAKRDAKKQADAAVLSSKAASRSAALDLEFTTIRSPISGRIGDRRIDVGNLVLGGTSGTTLLAIVVSQDPIYFNFDVSEADFLRYARLVASGARPSSRTTANPIFVRLADETGWPHKGKMDFVDNRLDPQTGTLHGRAILDNPGGFLQPGTFGRLRLIGSADYTAMLIPDSAILSDQSRKIVLTVADDGTVTPHVVTLGNLSDGLRVIKAGLTPEDKVIVNGLARARPGAKVTPEAGKIEAAAEAG